jgi:hypothetical protein
MKKIFLLLLTIPSLILAAPTTVDLHEHWDQRCESCHGHAAAFARRFLRIENGHLAGSHHNGDLNVFLHNHYLNQELIVPVTNMLQAQAVSQPLFKEKCANCHGTASEFARASLLIKDGVLIGKSKGRKVTDFLKSHCRLKPDEIQTIVDSLTRVRNEVSAP